MNYWRRCRGLWSCCKGSNEFLNHINGLTDFNEKPSIEISHAYETSVASLVGMMEARFVNLNPQCSKCFLNTENIFDEASKPKRKDKEGSQPYISKIDCLCEKSTESVKEGIITYEDEDDLDFEKT